MNEFINKYEKVIREIEDCIEIINSKNIVGQLDKSLQEKFVLEKDENGWVKPRNRRN